MKPTGKHPQVVTKLDNDVFDLQSHLDDQITNTGTLLEYMDQADDDGVIDADEWRHIWARVAKEHDSNQEAWGKCRKIRAYANELAALVTSYRTRIQRSMRAAA